MKKISLLVAIFLLFLTRQIFAYEIRFTSPTNLQVFVCSVSTGTAAVNLGYSSSGEKLYHYYYSKLYTDGQVYNSKYPNVIPQWFYLSQGTHNWRIELWEGNYLGEEYKVAEQSITFYVKFTIYAANNFQGGTVNLESSTVSSGSSTLKLVGESVSVGAIDQNDGSGYYRIWNTNGTNNSYWLRGTSQISSSQNYSHYVASNDNGITLIADLKRVCSLTFQANSSMSINGNYRTSPYTESVVEQNSISALASIYSANGIDFTFSKWSSSGGDFYSPVTATEHKTYTAVYSGKPNNGYRSLSFNYSQEGQPVQVTWSKHPLDNSDITHYAVYRKVTTSGTPTLLTTVSATGSSSYTYTDYEYAISSGENKILLFYDVRAYYSPSSSYSDPSFEGVYGVYNISKQPDEVTYNQTSLELPATMTVSNYPNPFNPTTTISYQLPEQSFVTLKVFDILGREVATLVNEHKPAGMYNVTFNAHHPGRSREITSGVYIYTLSANGFVLSKKMLLAK
ncbi:MAG: T9SS type A sorting domain-containing protein [Bacteroidota bacterium]